MRGRSDAQTTMIAFADLEERLRALFSRSQQSVQINSLLAGTAYSAKAPPPLLSEPA